ncbi:MAG: cysteine dioxygenase family protein [Deltaproteobacteria bacterium]|nr:cysteine dioxygenase family protein [Deltaproteobacteria bacterium]
MIVFLNPAVISFSYPMKQTSLNEFLEFLNKQTARSFKTNAVHDYLATHAIDHEEFLPYTFFREETYGRNLVAKNEFFELLVLTWLPEQRTPIHDHADQRCWMLMELGSLTFKNYEAVGPITEGKQFSLTPTGKAETLKAGTNAVYIDDGIGLHSIANASRKPAISVHLYASPIPRCRIYNESLKNFSWVDLEYFTFSGNTWTETIQQLQ